MYKLVHHSSGERGRRSAKEVGIASIRKRKMAAVPMAARCTACDARLDLFRNRAKRVPAPGHELCNSCSKCLEALKEGCMPARRANGAVQQSDIFWLLAELVPEEWGQIENEAARTTMLQRGGELVKKGIVSWVEELLRKLFGGGVTNRTLATSGPQNKFGEGKDRKARYTYSRLFEGVELQPTLEGKGLLSTAAAGSELRMDWCKGVRPHRSRASRAPASHVPPVPSERIPGEKQLQVIVGKEVKHAVEIFFHYKVVDEWKVRRPGECGGVLGFRMLPYARHTRTPCAARRAPPFPSAGGVEYR